MNIQKTIKIFSVAMIISLLMVGCTSKSPYAHLFQNLPFEMSEINPPVFPDNKVVISSFGGVGDGVTLNTKAFADAIEHLEKKGGGKLVVPAGVWFTGPIVLKSNINLYLEDKAIILFSPDKSLYPIIETSFEGLDTRRCQSPIWGKGLENVAITGSGTIDGNGQYWRPLKKEKVSENQWKNMTSHGGAFKRPNYWMPSEQYVFGDSISDMNVPKNLTTDEQWESVKDFLRPVMISLQECKNVFLQGVIFQNSPAWNIHPLMCENLIVDGVQVRNPSYAQNGDGIDIESCKNTIIVNSTFDVGDDGICVKSGKDEDGRNRNIPTENLIVDNCTVFKGHGGFVVGSEMSGGVKNVVVTNCQFLGTDVGLRFKSKRGRGGVVENINISNISMFDIATEPVLFDLYYGGKSAVESLQDGDVVPAEEVIPAVDETTPTFRNIHIKNIVCRNARRALYFNGIPEQNIENITVENSVIHSEIGAELNEVKDVQLINVSIFQNKGPVLSFKNANNVDIQNINMNKNVESLVWVAGARTVQLKITADIPVEKLKLSNEVKADAVVINR